MPNPETLKSAILSADIFQEGHFIFADGQHSFNKLEMDLLWKYPDQLRIILEALAIAEGLPEADVILGVPTGGQKIVLAMQSLGLIDLPVAYLERVPQGDKREFRFCTPQDQQLALSATSPRIYEDVVTTLSSIAGVVKLLDPQQQNINSLAIWRRGMLKVEYTFGVTPHFLIEEEFPSFLPEQCPVCN